MAKDYEVNTQIKVVNRMAMWLARAGIGGRITSLTTTGRNSGQPRTVPVSPIEKGDNEYLVAPYGERDWVKNVRANPTAVLRKGNNQRKVTLREVDAQEAAPVLVDYHAREGFARPFMDVPDEPTAEDFERTASAFPVFRVE